ncbi:hypothetical protein F5B20DRAFT_536143 [Whalleya microplaca]|nr:hypothetical protein F5B20DRAFT_536143 [Whalleya microplaca]
MKLVTPALLFAVAASATTHTRAANAGCCFFLSSVGVVNETVLEDHVGDLTLGGSFQQGGFCLDKSSKTIKDGLNNNCFMKAPDEQFECYSGAPGNTAFEVSSGNPGGKLYLTYDGGNNVFDACPIPSGGGEQTYSIYSSKKADKTGCLSVALALNGETPECSTGNSPIMTVTHRNVQGRHDYRARRVATKTTSATTTSLPTNSNASQAGLPPKITLKSTPAIKAASTAQACSVAPSSPSIAPHRLSYGSLSVAGSKNDSTTDVTISPGNSTIFEYHIPNSFIPSPNVTNATSSPLCALQFRMPYCTDLPQDYPCYSFSGMEQEMLSNSGMNFNLIKDDGNATWNNTALNQVFPGENTFIGTFECGSVAGGTRKMSWNVSSVRNFSLEFLQAGVGKDAEFQDGIGAWIVQCE